MGVGDHHQWSVVVLIVIVLIVVLQVIVVLLGDGETTISEKTLYFFITREHLRGDMVITSIEAGSCVEY